jgi:nucleotide-binding universal stress UspA family protein
MTTSASIAARYTELPRVKVVAALPVSNPGVTTFSSPLLVATNGSMASAAALRIAAAIARRAWTCHRGGVRRGGDGITAERVDQRRRATSRADASGSSATAAVHDPRAARADSPRGVRTPLTDEGITIQSRIECGDVVDVLLRAAQEAQADVIACGDKNPSSSERQLLGATPSQLLLSGDHSVLIAPPAVPFG